MSWQQVRELRRRANWWTPKDCSMRFSTSPAAQAFDGFGTNSEGGPSLLSELADSFSLTLTRFAPGYFRPLRFKERGLFNESRQWRGTARRRQVRAATFAAREHARSYLLSPPVSKSRQLQ